MLFKWTETVIFIRVWPVRTDYTIIIIHKNKVNKGLSRYSLLADWNYNKTICLKGLTNYQLYYTNYTVPLYFVIGVHDPTSFYTVYPYQKYSIQNIPIILYQRRGDTTRTHGDTRETERSLHILYFSWSRKKIDQAYMWFNRITHDEDQFYERRSFERINPKNVVYFCK